MAKPGRPPAVTEEIGKIIAVIRDNYPDWSLRTIQKNIPNFSRSAFHHPFIGKIPSLNPIKDYIKDVVDPTRSKLTESGIDKAWSSAALVDEPISPDIVQALVWMQLDRKLYFSKPLSIREARWFNNLSGLKQNYPFILDPTVTSDLKNTYLFHLIATWAQIYAYRERIDIIADIKEPDYSDLDEAMVSGNIEKLLALNDYGERWLLDDKWKGKYLMKDLNDKIRFFEIGMLGHSLGDLDVPDAAVSQYAMCIATLAVKADFMQRYKNSPYLMKIQKLIILRKMVKDHTDVSRDLIIKPIIEQNIDETKKEKE